MIRNLENVFINREGRLVDGKYDITLGFAIPFSKGDWYLESAQFSADRDDTQGEITLVFGLRDCILVDDEINIDPSENAFLPCNLFGLVPLIIMIASRRSKGLETAILETTKNGTFVKLHFRSVTTKKEGWYQGIARSVVHFMRKWEEYSETLERILDKDPTIGYWKLEWRDFLAEFSGFETSPWYPVLSDNERAQAIECIKNASKSLIYSVLSREECETPLVQELLTWLNELSIEQKTSDYLTSPMEVI